jgi:hypothetical protein
MIGFDTEPAEAWRGEDPRVPVVAIPSPSLHKKTHGKA